MSLLWRPGSRHGVVTAFHVLWFCIAAFLLLNLVTGAVINNYQLSIEEAEERKKFIAEQEKKLDVTT